MALSAEDLPDALVARVLSCLQGRLAVRVAPLVCSRWKSICDADHTLWRQFCSQDFGIVELDSRQCPTWRRLYMQEVKWRRGKVRRSVLHNGAPVLSMRSMNGGRVVTHSADQVCRLWDTRSLHCDEEIGAAGCAIHCVATDGARIVYASRKGRLSVWESGAPTRTLCGGEEEFVVVEVHNGRVLCGSRDGGVQAWHLGTGECLFVRKEHRTRPTCLACGDGKAFVGRSDGSIDVLEMETGEALDVFHGHTDAVSHAAWRPGWIASAARDKTLRIWGVTTGECARVVCEYEHVACLAWHRDRVLSGSRAGTLLVWDALNGELENGRRDVRWCACGSPVTCVKSFGSMVAIGTRDGAVRLLDPETGVEVRRLSECDSRVSCLDVVEGRLVAGFADGMVIIWGLV